MTTIAKIKVMMWTKPGGRNHMWLMLSLMSLMKRLPRSVKKVVVEEVVVGSSRTSVLPRNLIAPLSYRITKGEVPEDYCPFSRCTPDGGM